jgi:pyruvate/2-oxoglutarate dehydrogenase complex dihydrolipoamide dehydrogenase (E3) component
MAQSFDAIVLGAGAMGSAASYYLAKARQRVLCLEPLALTIVMVAKAIASKYGLNSKPIVLAMAKCYGSPKRKRRRRLVSK